MSTSSSLFDRRGSCFGALSRAMAGAAGVALLCASLASAAFAQETTRVSVDSAGVQGNGNSGDDYHRPSLSSDGRFVLFESTASNLVANDTNASLDVFVHDRATGTTERVSVDSSGAEGNGISILNQSQEISADGMVVVFFSAASNLVANDTNASVDVFVHDRATGTTERVSVDSSGVEGNADSDSPAISADGQVVAFGSIASNFYANDTNGRDDVFVHDRRTGVTEVVSVDSSGVPGNYGGFDAALSADGQIVAFSSESTNLVAGDANFSSDIFVHDRNTGITTRVSVDSTGAESDNGSYWPAISGDGRFVTFTSWADNLVAGDTNQNPDVFVHDRATGVTELASLRTDGKQGNVGSYESSISDDGVMVAFYSLATNMVAGDTNFKPDTFVHDRSAGTTRRVSVDSAGAQGDGSYSPFPEPAISRDGLVVAFSSGFDDLVAGDSNGVSDIFVHELCSTPASWSNYGAGFPGTNGVPTITARANPVLGESLTLDLSNSYVNQTAGLLFVGFTRTSIHSGWGGDLLVVPALTISIAIPPSGLAFTGILPHDDRLCGFAVDLQAIEADPGAARGVAFTAGLELILGR
jgi:hypothetical protein